MSQLECVTITSSSYCLGVSDVMIIVDRFMCAQSRFLYACFRLLKKIGDVCGLLCGEYVCRHVEDCMMAMMIISTIA